MQPETATRRTNDILAQLKEETAQQHQQTEDGIDLMREDFSREDYRDLLVRFYAFYKSFEEKMRNALAENPIEFDHEERLNTPKLVKDLQSLGMSEDEIAEIESTDGLPALDSKERIFGSLYVIEGSTLGGQVISRHLKQKFGFDETNGSAFFSGYGRETGTMWKAFGAAITDFAEQSDNHQEIIAGANETFEKIGNSLKKI